MQHPKIGYIMYYNLYTIQAPVPVLSKLNVLPFADAPESRTCFSAPVVFTPISLSLAVFAA
jgi:hypothetical protein